jgi:CBS domain-containing protein
VWAIALGSGTSGGVLAPLLIIGGALGAFLGQWLPGADVPLFVMVGMGAMMGGTMRSPLTAIVFVLELTHDLAAMPAVLVGTTAALCVTVLLMRRSILTEKLARRGQHIAREYSVDLFELIRVGDVMERDVPTVQAASTIGEFSERVGRNDPAVIRRHAALIVDDDGRLAGILTRDDVVRGLAADPSGRTSVLAAGNANPALAWADQPLSQAIATMLERDVGRLPVVDRDDPTLIRGYLGRAEILGARSRHQEEEEHRERGPLLSSTKASRE